MLLQKNAQAPEDPVSAIILRDIPTIARNGFLCYLGNALILVLVTNAVTIVFGSTATLYNGFFEVFGFFITGYAGLAWAWARIKPSKVLFGLFYLVSFLGILQAGVLYSIGAYQLASGGYWLKQTWSKHACKCTHDKGEVASVADKYLACIKCSRKLNVGYDIPKVWTRLGNAALLLGLALYVLSALTSSLSGNAPLTNLTWLLLINGFVFSFGTFSSRMQSGRFAHLPPNPVAADMSPPVS